MTPPASPPIIPEASTTTPSTSRPPKSPPLAFSKTSNDSLYAPIHAPSPQHPHPQQHHHHPQLSPPNHSPSPAGMGLASPPTSGERELQVIVDRQSNALSKMYEAFQAERDCWLLEKRRLHGRIGALEQLLKTGDHWRYISSSSSSRLLDEVLEGESDIGGLIADDCRDSPAKSPTDTPATEASLSPPPHARSLPGGYALPTINENRSTLPLSARREHAPQSLGAAMDPIPEVDSRRQSAVYTDADGFLVEAIEPRKHLAGLSPPPPNNLMLAGHTPVRVPRRPTPPPADMSMDGLEDTPTRNNTHINLLLSRSQSNDEDEALRGPLNMPELPHNPDETNFTFEALSKKLSQIEKDPESRDSKPMVFAQPSPGLASPVGELAQSSSNLSPRTRAR